MRSGSAPACPRRGLARLMAALPLLGAILLLSAGPAAAQYFELPQDTLRISAYFQGPIPSLAVPVRILGEREIEVTVSAGPILLNHLFWFVRLGPGLDTLWVPVGTWSAPPGEYAASVRVSYETQDGTVPVKVVLRAVPPRLELAPREFELRPGNGQTTGLTNLLIHNAGQVQLHYEVTGAPAWLRPSATSGDLPADSTVSISLSLDARRLAPGTITGGIDLTTNDPTQPNLRIPVRLVRQGLDLAGETGPTAPGDLVELTQGSASVELCPDDTFSDGWYGTVHSWADSLQRVSGNGGPPWSRWALKFNRPLGLQQIYCMGSCMWLVNADRLELRSDTPGLPFAFEVRLSYSLAPEYSYNPPYFVHSGHCSTRLVMDDSVRIAEAEGGPSGGARTGSLALLVAGFPGDFKHLEFSTNVCADGSNHGYATATANTSLSFRFLPAHTDLASCRPLPGTSHGAPAPSVAYAGITDGLAVVFWNQCLPGHDYRVEREVAGAWQGVDTPPADGLGHLIFSEPATSPGVATNYRLRVDGKPGAPVRVAPPVEGPSTAVKLVRAAWATDRVTLRWETNVAGLPFACERNLLPTTRWETISAGTVPADGVVALADSLARPGNSYGYRLVFPALGAAGGIELVVPASAPLFDASPGALHYGYSVDEFPSPLRVVLTNRRAVACDVDARLIGLTPLRDPANAAVHLPPLGSAILELAFNWNAAPGEYSGVLRLTATPASDNESDTVLELPVTLSVFADPPRLRPEIVVYPSDTPGWLEARARLVPGPVATIRLFDALGRERDSREISTESLVPLHLIFGRQLRLPSGVYFVRVTQGGQVVVGRGAVVR